MRRNHLITVGIIAALGSVGTVIWLLIPPSQEAAPDDSATVSQISLSVTPLPADSPAPAAGICAAAGETDTVAVVIRPDAPDPRCQRIAAGQHLAVRNGTAEAVTVWFGSDRTSAATLVPGGEFQFTETAGNLFAAGAHILHGEPFSGPEIWFDPGWPRTPRLYRFRDFPAETAYGDQPAPVDFSTHPEARNFSSRIIAAAAAGPNFNGHYTVVEWGCGTSCQAHAIVDAVTGAVVHLGPGSLAGLDYRMDSRLLVVNPPERLDESASIPDGAVTEYYDLTEGEMKLMARQQPLPPPGEEVFSDDRIRLVGPQADETVSSPLVVTGAARGYWYFEGSFPVALVDADGRLLARAPAQAQGEWMTDEFVPFLVSLAFDGPVTPTGTLILNKDNPSGLPEHAAEIRVPVRFFAPSNPKRAVQLHFYDPGRDRDESGNIQCSRQGLVAVARQIPVTQTPIQDTVRLLLQGGLTDQERSGGVTTEFPLSGLSLEGSTLNDGVLTLEFADPDSRTSGGSCRVGILRSQIEATAAQFPEVDSVRFLPEELFQP